uniref:Uncharacterized protein n=1 Tax=Tanacetum cinerariifolium TaxID=118510 RepID=A0A6L2NR12_TANCI|nr:hypothetical protein [Tanacetum cinerariifolium]
MGIRIPQSNVPSSVADKAITKEMHDGLRRATSTASSLEAEQGSGNISKTQTKETPSGPNSLRTSSEGGPGCHVTIGVVLFRLGLKGYLTCPMNHHTKKVTHLEVGRAERMIEEINEDKNVNLVKSSKQWEAHETDGHRMESDDTKVVDFSTASPQKDDDEITLAETLVDIKKTTAKDKGKAIMQEFEPPKKINKKEIIQISLDEEIAQRFYEEEKAQLLRDEKYAQQVQAQWIQVDEDLAQRMLEEERESLSIKERSRLPTEFINQIKKMLAAKRAKEKRNKPPTHAQQRTYMSNYIQNMGGYTLKQLKRYSFEEIKMLLDRTMKSIRKFVLIESKGQIAYSKAGDGSSIEGKRLKRPAEEELGHEHQMKQKEIYTKGTRHYWKIIRVGNITEVHHFFVDLIKDFDRKDLVKLQSLVMERFSSSDPTEDKEIALWVELKRLFKPDVDDELWKFESFELIWRLYDWELHAPKRDLRLIDEHFKSVYVDVISIIAPSDVKTVESTHKIVDVNHKGVFGKEKPKPVMKNKFSPPTIEDWHSNDESEVEISPTVEVNIVKPSIENIKFVKTARETVKNKESSKQHKHHHRENQRNWNNLMGARLKHIELMELSEKLSDRVLDLEKIKAAQVKEIADLKKRVKNLERKRRSRTPGMNLFKISTSRRRSLGEDDASKHGKNLK